MKIYLAARYSRHEEMRRVRDDLKAIGHIVTSRWIDLHDGQLTRSYTIDELNTRPSICSKYAIIDCKDIFAADMIISFTSADGGGKGGRHVEFGIALAAGLKLMVVGPRENIFHTWPKVIYCYDWADALVKLNGLE